MERICRTNCRWRPAEWLPVTNPEELATRATSLLVAVAEGRMGAAQEYDTLLYPVIFNAVKQRGRLLVRQAAQLTGTDGMSVPFVPDCDLEWVANDVAVHALDRARANAGKFDPTRGDGASWALRQAAFSYVDVVRSTYDARRAITMVPTTDEQLTTAANRLRVVDDPAVVVEQRAALDAALAALPVDERSVVLLTMYYGLTYAETAELVFRDASQVRRVDRLRQSARRRLAAAEQAWRAGR